MERHEIEEKYNNVLRQIISQLEHFNFSNGELKRVKSIFNAYAQLEEAEPIIATGPFIRMFEKEILENDVESLLSYPFEDHIFPDSKDEHKELATRLISVCKNTWKLWMNKKDFRNMGELRVKIIDLLIYAMEYDCPIMKAQTYEEYEKTMESQKEK